MRFLFFCLSFCCLFFACSPENKTSTVLPEENQDYREQHRPQFHFTPEAHWMNDPNGMVYYQGEYHLFYQYYPDSTVWGPMHWGHAVSPDMVHWEHLPIALYPDSLGLIFSGSAVIDWNNTSGLATDSPAMIAIFTHHNMEGEKSGGNQYQYQSIAYSNDRGRTWAKYEGNPVVPNPGIKDFRDPKVIWHEASQRWVMVFAAYDKVRIYHSPNLKDWTFASEFGIPGDERLWECPDLFPLQVEDSEEIKWILITSIQQQGPNGGTATSYFVGDFDGENFVGDPQDQHWLDYGRDNYALVSWSDVPKNDGRRLALGWMSNWQYAQVVPTEKWRSAMTIPRQLVLKNTAQGLRVISQPVEELQKLRGEMVTVEPQSVSDKLELEQEFSFSPDQMEMIVELVLPASEAGKLGFEWSNEKGEFYRFTYDATDQTFYSDRRKSGKTDFSPDFAKAVHQAKRANTHQNLKLHFFVDASSIEIFADEGEVVFTEIFFPNEPYHKLHFFSEGAETAIQKMEMYELKSIWK